MSDLSQTLQQKFPDLKIDVHQDDKNKTISLGRIVVPEHLRNGGQGTAFMQELARIADELGYTIMLTPSKDFGGNLNRLKDFYKRFDFIPNKGRNKDFSHQYGMYRLPKTLTEDEGGESEGNATATGHPWESGTTRGKANPISNHGNWESGLTRGKANPINEELDRMKKIMGL